MGLYHELLDVKFDFERYIQPVLQNRPNVFTIFAAARYKIVFPRDVYIMEVLTLQCDVSIATKLQQTFFYVLIESFIKIDLL